MIQTPGGVPFERYVEDGFRTEMGVAGIASETDHRRRLWLIESERNGHFHHRQRCACRVSWRRHRWSRRRTTDMTLRVSTDATPGVSTDRDGRVKDVRRTATIDLRPHPPYRPGMDRRRFLLTALAGALAGPRVAEGQPTTKAPRVGFLAAVPRSSPGVRAFEERPRELGYVRPLMQN
jgi:hypothetical protein